MTAGSFSQNGLLGSVTASDTPSTSTTSHFLSKSNGLLKSPGIRPESAPETEDNPHTFKLTGLLTSSNADHTLYKDVEGTSNNAGLKSATTTNLLSTDSTSYNTPSTLEQTPIHIESSQDFLPSDCIRATTFGGKTTFLRRRRRQNGSSTSTGATVSSSPFSNLLETPIHRLLDDLAAQTALRLQHAPSEDSQTNADTYHDDALWVDRYRPTRFTDLIGNDRVAREAMGWLKQWDHCVFGKKRGKKRGWDGQEKLHTEDEYHRPREKILLMSGPPGLGKTTLAHVIACHAGYKVMEINASDARAGHIVEERIRPALEAGHAVNSEKPVLLVIDEIDGATGAGENTNSFIHNLIQLTQHKARKKRRPGQKQSSAQRPLLRPIICICNDINASSLSKLKPHAYQLRFTRPPDFYTVRRLQEICSVEGLQADMRALNTLVAATKGDFRGCLNTLQFIRSKNEDVTEGVVRRATAGIKEGDTTVLAILNNIFNPLTRKRAKELGLTEAQESKYVGRLSHEIEGSGKDSTIANGCFEHYATLRQHDPNFWRYESANEWLLSYDLLSASMYADGDFALLPYLPYALVPFHSLFQTRGSPRVERNYSDWEHLQLTRSNESIYESFARCLRNATIRQEGGAYRHLISHPTLELEFTPYINRIISPPLRPVNSQVIRAEERQLLSRLVDIMAALDLRFVLDRGEDGQLSYRLDPPIDVFVTYDGKRATDIAPSRYAVRHLVATEIDAKLAGRDFDFVEKGKRSKNASNALSSSENHKGEVGSSGPGPIQKRPRTDELDVTEKAATDFFGRPILVTADADSKLTARKQKDKVHPVSYKFNEGNSAAVRKAVKVESFL